MVASVRSKTSFSPRPYWKKINDAFAYSSVVELNALDSSYARLAKPAISKDVLFVTI
jgi:hypothetical protein